MNNETETINKDRKPTAIDRKILDFLKTGQSIDHVKALGLFKTTMLRDSIWRLCKDGEPIQSKWHFYKTDEGKTKKYKQYFITEPEILPALAKTEKAMKGESVADYSRNIASLADKHVLQPTLF